MPFCKKHKSFLSAILFGLLLVLGACTTGTYEDGDGDYSYLRGDFALVTTDAKAKMVSFVTDEDVSVKLKLPIAIEGMKADTTYRALVYYNKPLDADAELVNLKLVNVCKPFKASKKKPLVTDPTGWESMWVSPNKAYLNMALNLKVGVSNEENADNKQVIGICQDSIVGRHFQFTLYHDQNSVPEYYTYTAYMSLPLGEDYHSGDTITMNVNTYDGLQQKTVILP